LRIGTLVEKVKAGSVNEVILRWAQQWKAIPLILYL
jgi:hypothetical protein